MVQMHPKRHAVPSIFLSPLPHSAFLPLYPSISLPSPLRTLFLLLRITLLDIRHNLPLPHLAKPHPTKHWGPYPKLYKTIPTLHINHEMHTQNTFLVNPNTNFTSRRHCLQRHFHSCKTIPMKSQQSSKGREGIRERTGIFMANRNL